MGVLSGKLARARVLGGGRRERPHESTARESTVRTNGTGVTPRAALPRECTQVRMPAASGRALGRGELPGEKPQALTLDQQEDLRQRLDRLNASKQSRKSFLGLFGVEVLDDIPAHEYKRAVKILEAKEKGAK